MHRRPPFHGLCLAATVLTVCGDGPGAGADPTSSRGVEAFAYFWDFEQAPTVGNGGLGFDLYDNTSGAAGADGLSDFSAAAGAGHQYGVVRLPDGAMTSSLIWPAAPSLSPNVDYTIELRLRASGTANRGVAIYETPSDGNVAIGGVSFLNDGGNTAVYYGTETAAGGAVPRATLPTNFIDVRVAAERNAAALGGYLYTLYVNGHRAGTDMPLSRIEGGFDELVLGDLGPEHQGSLEIDQLGFTVGAYAPKITYAPSLVLLDLEVDPAQGSSVDSDGNIMAVRYSTSHQRTYFQSGSSGDQLDWDLSHGVITPTSSPHMLREHAALAQVREVAPGELVAVYTDREDHFDQDPHWDNSHPNNHDHDPNTPPIHSPILSPAPRRDVWSIRSTNGGATWTDRTLLYEGFSSDASGLTVTDNGDLLAPIGYRATINGDTRWVTKIMRSSDVGQTWTTQGVGTAGDPLDIGVGHGAEDGLISPVVTQLDNGDALVLMRSTSGFLYQSISTDGGATWSEPTSSGLEASSSPLSITTLANGTTVAIFSPREPRFDDTVNDRWAKGGPDNHRTAYIASEETSYFREAVVMATTVDGFNWSEPVTLATSPGVALSNLYIFEREPNVAWVRIGNQWGQLNFNTPIPEPMSVVAFSLLASLAGRRNQQWCRVRR